MKYICLGYLDEDRWEAMSATTRNQLMDDCDTQEELDELWERLSDGGEKGRCGWLTDRFGVSWQVVPAALEAWMQAADAETTERLMQAILQMDTIDIEKLKRAGRRPAG